MSKYARRVDANHASVTQALEAVGCIVTSLAAVGHGVPDLMVLRHGTIRLIEVKDGSKVPSARRLTPQQEMFRKLWPVSIARSIPEALCVVDAVKCADTAYGACNCGKGEN